MNTDILKNSAASNREIKTHSLKNYGNCLEFKDNVIQLSNVSLVANNPLTLPKFPLWTIAALLLGFACLFVEEGAVKFFGVVLLCVGGFFIYTWNQQMEREKQLKKLVIATNSGRTFSILFEKGEFLATVIDTLKETIAHPGHHSDVIINIKDNIIGPGGSAIDTVNEINTFGGPR